VIFTKTRLKGAFVIERAVFEDERGSFLCFFNRREMDAPGLDSTVAEAADRPDFVLLLTSNVAKGILAQQSAHRAAGGRFSVPVPGPRVV
jgi:dTDP-4-dehydrorhamnose 3,5-epimerase-like enzyme